MISWSRVFLAAIIFLIILPGFSVFSQGEPINALQNYRTGRDLEARNRRQEAEVYYNTAVRMCMDEIALNGGTRDSYTVLTWALRRQEKYADVITWGERGLKLFEDEYRIVEIMGEAYFYQDDYENSLKFMQRYVNAMPQGEQAPVAYFFVGEIFRLTQKFHLAEMAYTTAVRLEPSSALWWYRLGSVREAVGDFGPAVEAYERALRLNPAYREAADGLERSRGQG